MRKAFAFVVFAAMLAGSASIAKAGDCLAQAWKGTIGTVPVTMEFDFGGEDAALVGRYYYRTGLVDLLLMSDGEKPGRWKELDPKGAVTGTLTLSCSEKTLSGTWSSPDGSKTLPVQAGALPTGSYSRERLGSLKTKVIERSALGKFKYEVFTAPGFDAVKGLRLLGEGKALADINGNLLERFTSSLDAAIDCLASGRWRRGEDHGYAYETEMNMVAWNEVFVVIGQNSSEYCGGAHPLSGSGATTYNLRTGKVEDASQWLSDQYRGDIPKDSPLGKIILKNYTQEDECGDIIELSGEGVWPTPDGMTFQPTAPYAQSGCIDDLTVPYKDLAPYLTPQGKENAQAFKRP